MHLEITSPQKQMMLNVKDFLHKYWLKLMNKNTTLQQWMQKHRRICRNASAKLKTSGVFMHIIGPEGKTLT